MVLPSFAQSGCGWDASTGTITCPSPSPPQNPPGCDYLGDPDCDDGDDGGSSGGGGNDPDPDALACTQHYQFKDEECLIDPEDQYKFNWNPFGTDFSLLYSSWAGLNGLPSGFFPDYGAPVQVYQNIIRDVAQAYWTNQTSQAISSAYWSAVNVFCIGFPEEAIFTADRADCYEDAYSVSLRLIPSFSDHAFTISQVEGYGVTIQHLTSNNPFANWAAQFLTEINDVKECKIWFDGKDQIPGCE